MRRPGLRRSTMLDTASRLSRVAAELWHSVDRLDHQAARRRVAWFRERAAAPPNAPAARRPRTP